MEMEQMMECLLAKIDSRMDANTKAMQEKADANLKELKEDIKTNQAKTNIDIKEMMEEMIKRQQSQDRRIAKGNERRDQIWPSGNEIQS
jgi:hypothetical protein